MSRFNVPSWTHRSGELDLSRPVVLGVLNVTPDSFSDGGAFPDAPAASRRAEALVAEGADVLDVGGESTRPGADPVPAEVELDRVLPVVRVAARLGVPVSIDTTKAGVAREAIEAGAAIVNDVSALADPEMGSLVAESGAGLVLMHRKGSPRTMQADPRYNDVVAEVGTYLEERRAHAEELGILRHSIVLDPGIGFGKTLAHNLRILAGIDQLVALGSPVLLGTSRKSFIGKLTDTPAPADRMPGSLASILAAWVRGVRLFRVHDVAATRQALAVFTAIERARTSGVGENAR